MICEYILLSCRATASMIINRKRNSLNKYSSFCIGGPKQAIERLTELQNIKESGRQIYSPSGIHCRRKNQWLNQLLSIKISVNGKIY